MESDPALAGPAHCVVQHPVALEGLDQPVVHHDGDGHGNDLLGLEKPLLHSLPPGVITHVRDGQVELLTGDSVEVQVLAHLFSPCGAPVAHVHC